MNTKYFVVLFFIVSASAIRLPDPLRGFRETCGHQAGLTKEQLLIRSSIRIESPLGPYLVCLGNKINVLSPDGTVDVGATANVLAYALSPAVTKNTLTCCQNKADQMTFKNEVELVLYLSRCFRAKLPTDMYNLIGVFGKPAYYHLETCDLK